MSLKLQALEIAKTQLGVKEKPLGSNGGKEVDMYLKSVGLGTGYSWCMAFIYWCFLQACIKAAIACPLIKTGGVLAAWNKADKKFRIVDDPQPGDIGIMSFGNGAGHTFIIEKRAAGVLQTIEGNSNNDGSRNGTEVVRHQRQMSNKLIKGYLRYE